MHILFQRVSRLNFLPYLVFTLLKILMMLSLCALVTARIIKYQMSGAGAAVAASESRYGECFDRGDTNANSSAACKFAGNTTRVVLSVEGHDLELNVAWMAAVCTPACQQRCSKMCNKRKIIKQVKSPTRLIEKVNDFDFVFISGPVFALTARPSPARTPPAWRACAPSAWSTSRRRR